MECFDVPHEFCPNCGSIFPHLRATGNVSCYTCKSNFRAEVSNYSDIEYTVLFNTFDPRLVKKSIRIKEEANLDGPIVEKKCPKCENNEMSYATMQLRSADEGQTVFFTCTKCKYKESENS